MDTTMRIVIAKNQYRGWSCTTHVKYSDWPNEVVTGAGYPTLKSALWHTVLDCMDLGAKLLSVTVNDRNMSFWEVWRRISLALADGPLAHVLPDINKLLEVTDDDSPRP